jgi:hypothetical protein
LGGKFRGWHRLAARHASDVADDAFYLVHTAPADEFAGSFG